MVSNLQLLQPGFAGEISLDEALFIQKKLEERPALRVKWGLMGDTIPLTAIAARAFPENPEYAKRHIQVLQRKAKKETCS